MTITTHRCQCHELESGLCYPCEVSLAEELADTEYTELRSDFEAQNPPSGSEVWPR
jgi:hypothetical protein